MPNEILKQTVTEPRDNTITRFATNNYTPPELLKNENQFYKNLRHSAEKSRLDDGPLGFVPVVGDILSGAQAINDFNNKKYLEAGATAGMLLIPNFIEKTVKPFTKTAFSKIATKIKSTENNVRYNGPMALKDNVKHTVNLTTPITGGLIGASATDSDSEDYWKNISKNFLTGSIIGFGVNKTLKLDNKISDKAVDVAKKYIKKKIVSPSIFFDRLAGNLPPIKFQIDNKGLKVKPITLSNYKIWVEDIKKQLNNAIEASGNTPNYGTFNFNTSKKSSGWSGLTTYVGSASYIRDSSNPNIIKNLKALSPDKIKVQLKLRDPYGRHYFNTPKERNGVMIHENTHATDWANGADFKGIDQTTNEKVNLYTPGLKPLEDRSYIDWYSSPNEWRAEYENFNYVYDKNQNKVKSEIRKRFRPLRLSNQEFDQVYQEIQSLYNKDHNIY